MSPPATSRSLPRLRWNWDFGPLLGDVDTSRLLQLLSALAEGGALGSAARASGMSYRSAWGLLRDCEQALGASMVVMERGRGTRLTEFGMALVDLDSAARRALEEVHAPWQRKLVAQTVSDCAAMLDTGPAALGTLARRGQDPAAPALALWREFHAARAAMVSVLDKGAPASAQT